MRPPSFGSLSTLDGVRCSYTTWMSYGRTCHLIPGTSTLRGNMRHQKTRTPTISSSVCQSFTGITRIVLYQTFPMPEIRFAQGVESLFPNPAKAPSSRNGESWSSNSETRSRAAQTDIRDWTHSQLSGESTYAEADPETDVSAARHHFPPPIPASKRARTFPVPVPNSPCSPGTTPPSSPGSHGRLGMKTLSPSSMVGSYFRSPQNLSTRQVRGEALESYGDLQQTWGQHDRSEARGSAA